MSENTKTEIPVKINYDNKQNYNHNNKNNENQNKNNFNQKKFMKHNYKLYFFITLWALFITIIYFINSNTPENRARKVYEANKQTYNQLNNIKNILNWKDIKEDLKK